MIVRFYFENGYPCCNEEEFYYYNKEDVASGLIDVDVQLWGCENAEAYSYVHLGLGSDYTDEEYDEYVADCGWGWEEQTWEQYVEYCENWGLEPNPLWKE